MGNGRRDKLMFELLFTLPEHSMQSDTLKRTPGRCESLFFTRHTGRYILYMCLWSDVEMEACMVSKPFFCDGANTEPHEEQAERV